MRPSPTFSMGGWPVDDDAHLAPNANSMITVDPPHVDQAPARDDEELLRLRVVGGSAGDARLGVGNEDLTEGGDFTNSAKLPRGRPLLTA